MKYIWLVFLLALSSNSFAGGSIGFGTIKGVKVGNSNTEDLKIFLETGFTHDDFSCNGVITVFKSNLTDARFEMIYSATMAAYLSGKKVRYYSHTDNCNATFIALQESYF